MIVVYIAGPFRASTEYQRRGNIARAEALALNVWREGMVALCPHLNTAHFDGEGEDALWLEGTMELLSRCDALLGTADVGRSAGAAKEIAMAYVWGIPVFYTLEDLLQFKADGKFIGRTRERRECHVPL